jgi:hypothetical protein
MVVGVWVNTFLLNHCHFFENVMFSLHKTKRAIQLWTAHLHDLYPFGLLLVEIWPAEKFRTKVSALVIDKLQKSRIKICLLLYA